MAKRTVHGSIITPEQTILTEIEFEGTMTTTVLMTFSTPELAQAYPTSGDFKHNRPFYDIESISGCQVRLLRKKDQ